MIFVAPEPTSALEGKRLETSGLGLSTSITEVLSAVIPLSTTDTLSELAAESCPAATIAVNCVELTKVVAREVPFTCTTLLVEKPLPVTVSVVGVPVTIVVGETLVTANGVTLPPPEFDD